MWVHLESNDGDWVYAQATDRLEELGWIPSLALMGGGDSQELPAWAPPVGCDATLPSRKYGQEILEQDCLRKMLAAEAQAHEAEQRAHEANLRAFMAEQRRKDIEEVLAQGAVRLNDLAERAQLVEQNAAELERSLGFLRQTAQRSSNQSSATS